MVNDRRAMYDGFSDKGAHSVEWFEITKDLVKLAFAGDRRKEKCSCNRCQNIRMLLEYEMSGDIASKDLCQTNWCGTSIETCRHPQPMSRMNTMMRIRWMT
jgi:hypothetical protein